MSKTDSNELTLEQNQLVNIYDRLASLGRAMQRATNSKEVQEQGSTAEDVQADKNTKSMRFNHEASSPR